jgi:hypothetical protein
MGKNSGNDLRLPNRELSLSIQWQGIRPAIAIIVSPRRQKIKKLKVMLSVSPLIVGFTLLTALLSAEIWTSRLGSFRYSAHSGTGLIPVLG